MLVSIHMIEAIIFDFGGPILKYEQWLAVFRRWDEKYNLPEGTFNKVIHDYLKFAHRGEVNNFSDYYERLTHQALPPAESFISALAEAEDGYSVDADMVEYIKSLKPNFSVALLSNFTADLKDFLERFDLNDLFDVVVSSADVKSAKPDPEIYHHTLKLLGKPPEASVFIDDLLQNVTAAKNLGMEAVLYEDFPQTKKDLDDLLS